MLSLYHFFFYRCAPLLEIVIYILQVYLLSSRTFLTQHIQNNPTRPPNSTSAGGGVATIPSGALDEEREKLKSALVLTQESAAIQILLEAAVDLEGKVGLRGGGGLYGGAWRGVRRPL